MDWPIARLAAINAGVQSLPAAPSVPISVPHGGVNTFGSYVEFLAAAGNTKNRLIVGLTVSTADFSNQADDYTAVQVATGAVGLETVIGLSEIIGREFSAGGVAVFHPAMFPVPLLVKKDLRIAVRTATQSIVGTSHFIRLFYVLTEDLISIGF